MNRLDYKTRLNFLHQSKNYPLVGHSMTFFNFSHSVAPVTVSNVHTIAYQSLSLPSFKPFRLSVLRGV